MNSTPAFDDTIYPWFKEYGGLKAFELLNGDKTYRDAQKAAFINGEINNPLLDYPDINYKDLVEIETQMQAFKELIWNDSVVYSDTQENEDKAQKYDMATRKAYLKSINEKIVEIRLLKITAILQEVTNSDMLPEEKERIITELMRKFKKLSEFIYGKPSEEIFAYSVDTIKKEIASTLGNNPTDELREAAKDLLTELPIEVSPYSFSTPSDETQAFARSSVMLESGDLINIDIDDETELDAQAIKESFELALHQLRAEGWKVRIDSHSSKGGIFVSHDNQDVVIPAKKKLKIKDLKSLILHEIGTHVARSVNGERSKLKLLGLGLFRNKDDEGIATLKEQVVEGQLSDFAGLSQHLAISFAYGLDGKPRDFRGTYEIMKKYFLYKNLLKGKTKEDALKDAENTAWARCTRTFRGTNCKTPGVCFNKDIFYRENNIDVWQVLIENPSAIVTFNIGRFDPSNPHHITLLTQLDILSRE